MAKAKKQEKPIEQRLEEALVLYEKTPYGLPSNWCWTRLINLVKHQSGNSKLIKGKLSSVKTEGLYDGYSASGQDVFCPNYEHEGEAIIVSAVGARCGKAFLAKGKWSAIANTHIVYPNAGMNIKFLFYLMNDEEWWVRSGSAQPFVVVKESLERPFALPPHEEQKRIVEIIEKQFAKLDEARDLIQKSLDSFADRKSAILHKAFTGELTKKWREHINQCFNLTQCTLQDVCLSIFDGDHMPPPQTSSGIPFLVIGNVNKGVLSFENTRYVSKEYYASLTQSRKPELGDVLYTLVGSYGIAVLVDQTRDFCFQRHMALLKVDRNKILPKFLWYVLQSQEVYNQATNIATGTAQLTVPIKGLRKVVINVPSLEEQEEIVRILDSIFEKEDKSKDLIDMLDKIDEMKKSILARAFRGQLGTYNPTDEPAEILLKRIIEGGRN